MRTSRTLRIGGSRPLDGASTTTHYELAPEHLCTHGVVLGATGSGKTGVLTVLVEEALRAGVPTLLLDVKGDLSNLLLAFPTNAPERYLPLLEGTPDDRANEAARIACERSADLARWELGAADLADFSARTHVTVLTPGLGGGGSPLHLLSALERRSPRWDADPDAAREALSSAVTLLLRLLGRESDPARSREHSLLCALAERRFLAGLESALPELVRDVLDPPIAELGALSLDAYFGPSERRAFAAALNVLLASPTLDAWRTGAPLDASTWMSPRDDGRAPCTIVRVSHLDDTERSLVLALVLDEVLAWMRARPGSRTLRSLVVFDEVSGYLPPHPANPPTKRPLSALLKQGRAFGLGVLVATQHPMDLDYRALSDAGLWCVGKLQTDADRARVCESLGDGSRAGAARLANTVKALKPRWFVVRNAHDEGSPLRLLRSRATMSWLRGPLTPRELRYAAQP